MECRDVRDPPREASSKTGLLRTGQRLWAVGITLIVIALLGAGVTIWPCTWMSRPAVQTIALAGAGHVLVASGGLR